MPPRPTTTLSADAKAIAGSQFGGSMDMELLIVPATRTTARAKTALDELVAAGVFGSEPVDGGGICYWPLVDCSDCLRWLTHRRGKGHFRITLSAQNLMLRQRQSRAA